MPQALRAGSSELSAQPERTLRCPQPVLWERCQDLRLAVRQPLGELRSQAAELEVLRQVQPVVRERLHGQTRSAELACWEPPPQAVGREASVQRQMALLGRYRGL